MAEVVDVRCPVTPRRMFLRVTDDALEIACDDCRKLSRRKDPSVLLVLHRYGLDGVYQSTHVLRPDLHR